jgi:hypothetical protein
MTEAEWLEADNLDPLVAFLEREVVTLVDRVPSEHREAVRHHLLTLTSERKRRLLACAVARGVWPLLIDERSRIAVEVAERFADGRADDGELAAAVADAIRARDEVQMARSAARAATAAVMVARFEIRLREASEVCAVAATMGSLWPMLAEAKRWQAAQVRDIFGNPFRPPPAIDPSWLGWNDGAVISLARAIYEESRFEDTPVLADALEEAGCRDEEVLGHLRGPGQHAKGCFLIDLLKGRNEGTR